MVRMRMILMGLAVLALTSGVAVGATFYQAELLPSNVVPSSPETGYGQSSIIVNLAETQFHLTLNFAGLSTPETGAWLLVGAADEVGTPLIELPASTPIAIILDTTPALLEALDNEELFIQIYSEFAPDGALRGNYAFVTVGVDVTTWSQVKGLFN